MRAALSEPGRPLDEALRARVEPAFGHSFASVRVHSGPVAEHASGALGAEAFTIGHHIVLGRGSSPHDLSPTLAHELAHVVQSGPSGPGGYALPLEDHTSPRERAAEAAGVRVAGGAGAGRLAGASPAVCRKPITMPELKKQIAAKGHEDITELAKLLPDSGKGTARIREATTGGAKHVFMLDFQTSQQTMLVTQLTGFNATTYETTATTGQPPAQTVTHTIHVSVASNLVGDAVETLYHELVHARILMDKSLPEGERGETSRRYAQLLEMATDPALLAVTGTTSRKKAVMDAIKDLRAAVSAVPGFDAAKLGPGTTDDAVYEFLVNERFTGKESTSVVLGKPMPAATTAKRYASSVRDRFEKAIASSSKAAYTASGAMQAGVDGREATLRTALEALYAALDAQLATIAGAKGSGVPGATGAPPPKLLSPTFDPGLSPPLPLP